jgi:hypothetical protein
MTVCENVLRRAAPTLLRLESAPVAWQFTRRDEAVWRCMAMPVAPARCAKNTRRTIPAVGATIPRSSVNKALVSGQRIRFLRLTRCSMKRVADCACNCAGQRGCSFSELANQTRRVSGLAALGTRLAQTDDEGGDLRLRTPETCHC